MERGENGDKERRVRYLRDTTENERERERQTDRQTDRDGET